MPSPSLGSTARPDTSPKESLEALALARAELFTLTERASNFFKALADPTRLRILYLITTQGNIDVSSHYLARSLGLSAPTITHHMKKLLAANLVTRRQDGRWGYYSINPEKSDEVSEVLQRSLRLREF